MATNRTVVATLILDGVEGVERGFSRAGQAAVKYGQTASGAVGKGLDWVSKHEGELNRFGGTMTKVGTLGAAALGGLAWAAMDWESAWAGVTKTVDGSNEQMGRLEAGLRAMSKELPASHTEIAAVAEAAGQLGVETDSILGFTRTMLDLGETTNMSADEAATSLARLMNIMGTSQSDVDRLGSTVVALGNSYATTEAEIVAMGMRLAGVGSQMRMSESDVLAMAGAMSSVGIEAEAGGTAMSNSMKKIDAAVRSGGDKLELLAQVSGMSAEEFSASWRDNAGATVAAFTEGLGGMIASGQDANTVLSELGMTGIRESDSLLRLAGATEAAGASQNILRDALEMGAQAWDDNTALSIEAAARYETTAAQMQMAINGIKDEAITLGQYLLPIFNDLLGGINGLMEGFAGLDEHQRTGILAIAGVGTVAALAVGGVIKLVTGLANLRTGLATLGIAARTATAAMGVVGLALAAAGLLMGAWINNQAKAKARTDELTAAIRQQGEVLGDASRTSMAGFLEDDGVLAMAENLGLSLEMVTDAALGSKEAAAQLDAQLSAGISAIDERIAAHEREAAAIEKKMEVGTETDAETEQWLRLQEQIAAANVERGEWLAGQASLESVTTMQSEATADAAAKALRLKDAMGETGDAAGEAAGAIDESAAASQRDAAQKQAQAEAMALTADEMRELLDVTQAYGNALLQLSGSQMGMESAIAALNEQVAEGAAGLDLTTEAGRKNQSALDDLAGATMNYVGTLYEQGRSADEIAAATQRGREAWLEAASAMGMSAEQAAELADAYFAIPDRVETTVATPGALNSQREAEELNRKLAALPDEVKSEIISIFDRSGAEAAEAALNEVARDRIARINVKVVGGASAPVMGRTTYEADGGVLRFYRNGGMRENHVAQMAPAGAWRVWAEEETGGESYIPHAPSKRARSLQIWRETGRILGVAGFANGAVLRGPSPSITNNQRVTHVRVEASFPNIQGAADAEDFTRALPALLEQAGI